MLLVKRFTWKVKRVGVLRINNILILCIFRWVKVLGKILKMWRHNSQLMITRLLLKQDELGRILGNLTFRSQHLLFLQLYVTTTNQAGRLCGEFGRHGVRRPAHKSIINTSYEQDIIHKCYISINLFCVLSFLLLLLVTCLQSDSPQSTPPPPSPAV